MQPFETIYVEDTIVACNGGGGPLGHPKVYLNLSAEGRVECPYCSRLFLRGQSSHTAKPAAATGTMDQSRDPAS
ncbi:MAG TPA: zinc-finger domain-containing protein [Stellaceae bacterium]|nr:zinc-finger domain-containing protein [Stellaceae bacterium]